MTTKNAKNSSKQIANLRKAQESAKPSLAELVSGKSEKVASAVAKHAAARPSAPKHAAKSGKEIGKGKKEAARAENMRRAMSGKAAKKLTVAAFMRERIAAGDENAKVFAKAQEKFGKSVVGDDKKHYPSWYRSQMQRAKNEAKKSAKHSKKAA